MRSERLSATFLNRRCRSTNGGAHCEVARAASPVTCAEGLELRRQVAERSAALADAIDEAIASASGMIFVRVPQPVELEARSQRPLLPHRDRHAAVTKHCSATGMRAPDVRGSFSGRTAISASEGESLADDARGHRRLCRRAREAASSIACRASRRRRRDYLKARLPSDLLHAGLAPRTFQSARPFGTTTSTCVPRLRSHGHRQIERTLRDSPRPAEILEATIRDAVPVATAAERLRAFYRGRRSSLRSFATTEDDAQRSTALAGARCSASPNPDLSAPAGRYSEKPAKMRRKLTCAAQVALRPSP